MPSREEYMADKPLPYEQEELDRFEKAAKIVFKNEGGSKLTDYKKDPGGLTKFGFSKKNHPDLDIANLTEEDAKKLAKERYWDEYKINLIENDSVATHLYDMIYVQGKRGVRALQQAAKSAGEDLEVDGLMGQDTANAVKKAIEKVGEKKFHKLIAEKRLHQFESIKDINKEAYEEYIGGWTNRTVNMLDLFTKEK